MQPIWEFLSRIVSLFRNRKLEDDLSEELRHHLDLTVEENIRKGMTENEAWTAAHRSFGGIEQTKEHYRRQRGLLMIETLVQDLKYGLRILWKNPGFTVVALLSLALGIGANTALFQMFDAIALRTLPVARPKELQIVGVTSRGKSGNFSSQWNLLTSAQWEQIQSQQQVFSDIAAWGDSEFNISKGGETRYAQTLFVSGNFFRVLGVQAIRGRTLALDDDKPGCDASSAVISHAFWQREFGGDASAIGKKIHFGRYSFDIVGITPASFFGIEVGQNFDVAIPMCAEAVVHAGSENRLTRRRAWWLAAIGRLKPGVTSQQAAAQMVAISPAVFSETVPPEYPPDKVRTYLSFKLDTQPGGNGMSQLREDYLQPLTVLMAISGLVLLIACANLANLLLARASVREREIATRLAMGASRGRLIRQLLSESMLLAVGGTLLGVLVSQWLTWFLVSSISTSTDQVFVNLSMDWTVLGFIAGIAVLTCILFGLVPAIRATGSASNAIRSAGRGTTATREKLGLRRMLVISQVALSLVLFIGALLFVRTMYNLSSQNLGFERHGLAVARISFDAANVPADDNQQFKNVMLERLRAIPGVEAAADSRTNLRVGGGGWNQDVTANGHKENSYVNLVSSDYFKTMRIPMVAGRDIDNRDNRQSTSVAVVNDAFSRRFFDGKNPVGLTFHFEVAPNTPDIAYEIIGLVKDAVYSEIHDGFEPTIYFPESQVSKPATFSTVLIRSSLPASTLLSSVKRAMAEINPALSSEVRALNTEIEDSMLLERLMAKLSAFFGILAALLASLGLFGVMSYMVTHRKNEIGIRMALGATRMRIVAMILREVGLLVAAGLVIGTVITSFFAKTAGSLLFGLQPNDVATYAMGIAMLALIGIFSGLVPAQRASKLDPMNALRSE